MQHTAAHSPALDFPPLAWTPTVFGTDQLNRAGRRAQAWRRVSQTRPGPTARTSEGPAHPGIREAGAGLRGPTVADRKMREAEACRAHAPTVAHRKMREAGAHRANERPPGTPRGARPRPAARGAPGRTCPTGPGFVGSMCEHDTRVCPRLRVVAPASRRDSRQTSFHPDARERASQKARYWPSACE